MFDASLIGRKPARLSSCSVLVVFHHLNGFLLSNPARILQRAAGPGVLLLSHRCARCSRRSVSTLQSFSHPSVARAVRFPTTLGFCHCASLPVFTACVTHSPKTFPSRCYDFIRMETIQTRTARPQGFAPRLAPAYKNLSILTFALWATYHPECCHQCECNASLGLPACPGRFIFGFPLRI